MQLLLFEMSIYSISLGKKKCIQKWIQSERQKIRSYRFQHNENQLVPILPLVSLGRISGLVIRQEFTVRHGRRKSNTSSEPWWIRRVRRSSICRSRILSYLPEFSGEFGGSNFCLCHIRMRDGARRKSAGNCWLRENLAITADKVSCTVVSLALGTSKLISDAGFTTISMFYLSYYQPFYHIPKPEEKGLYDFLMDQKIYFILRNHQQVRYKTSHQ